MRTLTAVAISLVLLSPARADDGESIALAKVPDVVMQIVKKTVPRVEWQSAFKHKIDEGEFQESYRLVGKDAKAHNVSLMALPDGSIIYVRTEIAQDEVPAVVAKALKTGKPGFTPKRFEAVGPDDKAFVYYRFEGELANHEKAVMAVRADGKKVLQEELDP